MRHAVERLKSFDTIHYPDDLRLIPFHGDSVKTHGEIGYRVRTAVVAVDMAIGPPVREKSFGRFAAGGTHDVDRWRVARRNGKQAKERVQSFARRVTKADFETSIRL